MSLPIGTIVAYGCGIPPAVVVPGVERQPRQLTPGWLLCDGAHLDPVSLPQYAQLAQQIRNVYAPGYFLPDLQGRVIGGVVEGRTGRELGNNAGDESATLTADHLPVHAHQVTGTTKGGNTRSYSVVCPNNATDAAHPAGHNYESYMNGYFTGPSRACNDNQYSLSQHTHEIDFPSGEAGSTTPTAIELWQPTLWLNYIIKY